MRSIMAASDLAGLLTGKGKPFRTVRPYSMINTTKHRESFNEEIGPMVNSRLNTFYSVYQSV